MDSSLIKGSGLGCTITRPAPNTFVGLHTVCSSLSVLHLAIPLLVYPCHFPFLAAAELCGVAGITPILPGIFPVRIADQNPQHTLKVSIRHCGTCFEQIARKCEHIILPVTRMVSLSVFRNLYTHQIEYHGRFFLHYGQIKFQFQTTVSVETMRMAARPLTEDVVDNPIRFYCRCTSRFLRLCYYRLQEPAMAGHPLKGA